jgi:subtilisin-like proprotein convertase family protein
MLQANPNLTWRDVKQILVNTARKNDPTDAGWSLNGAGHWINHKYGFGSLDAAAAVDAARTWTNVAPEISATTGAINVNQVIPDNNATGVTSSVNMDALVRVETVEVEFSATHSRRGNLRVVLTSPDGTQSVLAEVHDDPNVDYNHWTFTSTRHWDEIARGTWKLTVTDGVGGSVGAFDAWKLTVYGTAVTNEQYVSLAPNANVTDVNFGFIPLPGAKVAFATFAYQTGQKLVFTFDRPIASSLSSDAFDIENETTGQGVADASLHVTYDPASRTATVTFSGLSDGLFPDGNYTARLKADRVTLADGGMLDGNGDGLGGDDYTLDFFQLNGDANRDRAVNTADLKILFANRGAANPTWDQADFNYDHAVDFIDFQTLEISLGHTLPAPAATPATATVGEVEELAFASATPAPPVARPGRPVFALRPIPRRHMQLLDDTTPDLP